jgi:hypothetical protein
MAALKRPTPQDQACRTGPSPHKHHPKLSSVTDSFAPSALISLSSGKRFVRSTSSGAEGAFSFDHLVPGRYTFSVKAEGFAPYISREVLVYSSRSTTQNVALKLETAEQAVSVNTPGLSVDTSADNNASAIVIKGKDLEALSDDPDELQSELNALAGPAAGPSGGQIYIDGFTGGQLPPKSSIREIRINSNPFSAQYDKLGYGRIEIFTKPGTDKFHGMFMVNGNDSAFNSLNPFVTNEPPYYSTATKSGCSPPVARSSSPSLCSTPRPSAASISRS